jgi:hypothetical protein
MRYTTVIFKPPEKSKALKIKFSTLKTKFLQTILTMYQIQHQITTANH